MEQQTNLDKDGAGSQTSISPAPVVPTDTLTILERAEKLNKETKEAEERILSHKKTIEELETRRIMGGQTSAGSINKTPEQLQKEEAQKMANDIVSAFKRKK